MNQMMTARLYKDDLIAGLGANLLDYSIKQGFFARGAGIDSRGVCANMVFFAIKGKNADGNKFAVDAVKNGAACVVGDGLTDQDREAIKLMGGSYVLVKNTVDALQQMARYRRENVLTKTRVVGITGSIGKTTTVKWMAAVLSKFCEIHAPEKNFNNHIGMPLTIINASTSVDILLLEMGMSSAGEIGLLAQIAKPDVAIITNIAQAHIENFGCDINGVVMAKAEIFSHVKPNGVVILNEANEHFNQLNILAKEAGIKNIVRVGIPDKSHLFVTNIRVNEIFQSQYDVSVNVVSQKNTIQCTVNSIYGGHVFNTLFIFALAMLFKFPLEKVMLYLENLSVVEGRGNIEYVFFDNKKIILVNDSYNSNPASLQEAIKSVSLFSKGFKAKNRIVCVIGDMLEQGVDAIDCHKNFYSQLVEAKIDCIVTVGELSKHLFNTLPEEMRLGSFKTANSLSKKIRSILQDGDLVLFKGSNLVNLAEVIKRLYR